MNDPSFPSDFIKKSEKEEGEAPTTVPDKLTLNFFLPHETTMKDSKVRELQQLRFQRMSHLYKSAEPWSMEVLTHMARPCLREAMHFAQP